LKLFVQGKDVAATEEIIELAHDTRLREFSGQYSDGTVGELPAALAGTVSLALHLQRNPSEQISSTATPFYDRGLYFVRSDKYSYDDAIPLLEQAAKLDPHSPLPLAALVEAEVGKFGLTKDKSHLEAARQRLSQAEALNPDSVTVRLAAGMLNEATGQSEKALQDYRRVQELEPRNVEASLRIGQIYDSLNMYDEALESYRKAIDLEPGYYEGYEWLGTFYYYRGKLAEAADAFQQAIERAPGRYGAYMNLGAVLDVLGRDEEAIASLKKSLAIKKTARALNSLGAVLAYQQRDRDAVEYYRQAVEMEPGNYKYFMNLADSERRLGQAQDARQTYKQGKKLVLAELQENPHLGPTRAYLAYFKTRLGDRDGAEEEMAEALQVSPNDTQVIRSAILSYDALGLKEKAFAIAHSAPADLLNELRRHPDLAEFSGDPRFLELLAKK
jgi:serine/threonine-protein kinase